MIPLLLLGVVLVLVGIAASFDVAGFARALSRYSVRQREQRGSLAESSISPGQARLWGVAAIAVGIVFLLGPLGVLKS